MKEKIDEIMKPAKSAMDHIDYNEGVVIGSSFGQLIKIIEEQKEVINGFKNGEGESHKADYIECPHCEYKHGEYHDYLETGDCAGEFKMDCPKCEKEFNVDFYSIFWFESKK
ncbi:hypothetical protein PP655_gp027 [Bacillus phage PBC4]|uniref:Uncharacterized protein n=1 Tax=Bacillus phage PBC4 TaxID=1675028 RepID=A0A1D6X868_9CAUD|nr:hypothetical protein PP655_gp027 [Bacillus phage PBC4]AKQ08219.1 hypothetical protein PBC4_027 [Bacillus phage PBC4]